MINYFQAGKVSLIFVSWSEMENELPFTEEGAADHHRPGAGWGQTFSAKHQLANILDFASHK